VFLLVFLLVGCSEKPAVPVGTTPAVNANVTASKPSIEESRPQVAAFCGSCHVLPSPGDLPKLAWTEEIDKGYERFFTSERTDLDVPPKQKVIDYFTSLAPDKLQISTSLAGMGPGKVRFRRVSSELPSIDSSRRSPVVSHVNWCLLEPDSGPVLVFCDMDSGEIRLLPTKPGQLQSQLLAKVLNPAHVAPCDLDADGLTDLVVADLGSFLPEDHDLGRVTWLKRTKGELAFDAITIQEGLGRVADVQPGDFDADGATDLIVAEFGWLDTGRLLLLKNKGLIDGELQFQAETLDNRHGAIHVPTADLNGDGHLDFIAVFSQEHESVVAFLNVGDGTFDQEEIFAADSPSYGSSGIEVVDLDGDGDLDVIYTNGDTFDSFQIKPYHAIRWLENRGSFPFVHHELVAMPGVHRALAGDLDGDNDLDIVAVALLPKRLLSSHTAADFASIIWLEQTGPGRFEPHTLESATPYHASLELGDFDADGDLDLAIPHFRGERKARMPWMTIWWNLLNEEKNATPSKGRSE
jgi:hypothetical protein